MILGRNTLQWMGLITAAAAFVQTVATVLLTPDAAAVVGVILSALVGFLGVFIAFVANTSTTPVDDPKLKAGTLVQATDEAGTVIGHVQVPVPEPPPVVPAEVLEPPTP